MAFWIHMPRDFKIGETRDCRINQKPERLTWRDAKTLVIEPNDAREIVFIDRNDAMMMLTFVCADADGTRPVVMTDTGL